MISTFNGLSRELRRRVMLMIGRAVLTVVNDSTGLQTVQVEALRGEVIDGAERMQLYGITSHPLKGADVLVLSVGGVRQHPVVLIDDRRHRVKGLAEGEVCIYTARGRIPVTCTAIHPEGRAGNRWNCTPGGRHSS